MIHHSVPFTHLWTKPWSTWCPPFWTATLSQRGVGTSPFSDCGPLASDLKVLILIPAASHLAVMRINKTSKQTWHWRICVVLKSELFKIYRFFLHYSWKVCHRYMQKLSDLINLLCKFNGRFICARSIIDGLKINASLPYFDTIVDLFKCKCFSDWNTLITCLEAHILWILII